jgi:hypothetical protein
MGMPESATSLWLSLAAARPAVAPLAQGKLPIANSQQSFIAAAHPRIGPAGKPAVPSVRIRIVSTSYHKRIIGYHISAIGSI